MSEKSLIMYSRSYGCPFITLAKRVLKDHAVTYREIMIDKDSEARQRVVDWTGFLSVPTLVVAEDAGDFPYAPPSPLEAGHSPRGIDRETMITEPNIEELTIFLERHGFVTADTESAV